MGLLGGGARTATIRTVSSAELLEIGRDDFNALIAADPMMARAVRHLSHERAIRNLSSGGSDASTWATVASESLEHISRAEANKMLREAGRGAGLAIVLGNILDTIPGCLVIGATFNGLANLSLTLMLGMFLGGIPEAAASAAMLTRAGYKPKVIFALWATVLVTGMVAAGRKVPHRIVGIARRHFLRGRRRRRGSRARRARDDPRGDPRRGFPRRFPTVAGFLFALYLALGEALV